MSKGFALFDLDHTLLPFDTQAYFCNFVLRREGWRRIYLLWFGLLIPLAAVRLIGLETMKRFFFSYLWGMKKEKLEGYVKEFVETEFAAAVYPEILEEVNRHRREGRTLILNSASPEFYLVEISQLLGFDHYVGTQMEIPETLPFYPRLSGGNNKHEAKITAMKERGLIPEEVAKLPNSWAYSDSSADIPLLDIAEEGVMIHPGSVLKAEGQRKGWHEKLPARPYEGKWGARRATLLQAFGFWKKDASAGG